VKEGVSGRRGRDRASEQDEDAHMSKSVLLPVAVVQTALTTACSVYDTYLVRPVEAGDLEQAVLCGVTTRAGESLRFSPIEMTPIRSFALLRADTLFANVDWRARRVAVSDLYFVWLRRRAPVRSFLVSVLVACGVAVAVRKLYPISGFVIRGAQP
jgi:hypothetical protein